MNFIPHTVDGIFRDLNRESKVTICLSGISGQPVNLHTDQGYSVEKVNNCTTAKEFYARLLSHCTGARLAAMDALLLRKPVGITTQGASSLPDWKAYLPELNRRKRLSGESCSTPTALQSNGTRR